MEKHELVACGSASVANFSLVFRGIILADSLTMPQKKRTVPKIPVILFLLVLCVTLSGIFAYTYMKKKQIEKASSAIPLPHCTGDASAKTRCFEAAIDERLKTRGLDAAFDLLASLYATEPVFAASCHDFAHTLGREAYRQFAAKQDVAISTKASYCGYGFYHGFMETLLQKTGDYKEARAFCEYAQKKLLSETSDAGGACYHGIGHGAVDGSDPRYWGDTDGMIRPAWNLCENVSVTEHQMYRCITGIYNALEILSHDGKYKLKALTEDPYSFCNKQPTEFREGCHTNISLAIALGIAKGDFVAATKLLDQNISQDADYAIRTVVISGLFHEYIRTYLADTKKISEGVGICRNLGKNLHLACIDGLSGGFMKYGEPKKEYVAGLAFCASDLTDEEKKTCYQSILPRLRIWYSPEKSQEICAMAPLPYQEMCVQS